MPAPTPAPPSTRPSSPCAPRSRACSRSWRPIPPSLTDLRNQGAGAAGAYQEAKAHITTRLQVGTTRGNPELVAEWNTAQGQLDALSANINALNALGTDVTNDSSTAHFALDQIGATFNVSGAVDEDHRQLPLLEDETSQTIVMIDRLLKEVSDDMQRQTAYVANERANLTTLAAAIKNGELLWRRRDRVRWAAAACRSAARRHARWWWSGSTIPMSIISRSSMPR